MRRYLLLLLLLTLLLAGCRRVPADPTEPVSGWKDEGNQTYYINKDGSIHVGWLKLDGKRYCLGRDGVLQTGWFERSGKRYYADQNGVLQTGWLELDGKRYYTAPDGILQTGWLELDSKLYYADQNGTLQTGWFEVDSNRYYADKDGVLQTGWLELDGKRYYADESGILLVGWHDLDTGRYYFNTDGVMHTGWLEWNNRRYHLNASGNPSPAGWLEADGTLYYLDTVGAARIGWLQVDGNTYYLKDDGSLAKGKLTIDGVNHYFTSKGIEVVLVNPWNYVPDNYTVEIVYIENDNYVDKSCIDPLREMLQACRAAGLNPQVCSGYRRHTTQTTLFNNKVNYYLSLGYDSENARRLAAMEVAVPGTSEHELGLAVDIVDNSYWVLDEYQEKTPAQKWLMQHCWEYGFILRYPNSKSASTGIIYEPWHYRYVGKELAMEIRDSGLCLEEYFESLS